MVKLHQGFVSNSSSASYVVCLVVPPDDGLPCLSREELQKILNEYYIWQWKAVNEFKLMNASTMREAYVQSVAAINAFHRVWWNPFTWFSSAPSVLSMPAPAVLTPEPVAVSQSDLDTAVRVWQHFIAEGCVVENEIDQEFGYNACTLLETIFEALLPQEWRIYQYAHSEMLAHTGSIYYVNGKLKEEYEGFLVNDGN